MFNQPPKLDDLFNNLAEANQNWFNNLLNMTPKTDASDANPFLNVFQQFFANTQTYLTTHQQFYQDQLKMWEQFSQQNQKDNTTESKKSNDRRFADTDWENNPFFAYLKQSYLNVSEQLQHFISKTDMDEETRFRMQFFMRQYLDAIAPSNFALTNPEVIKAMLDSKGQSLTTGLQNLMDDMQNGYITMTDESQFKVGTNLAITKGSVIFKNELIELIQYAPASTNVYATPLLIVPPCINKYYILDLQQENSMVKYLVDQGYNVFLVSWKSADHSIRTYGWDKYVIDGAIKAIEVIRNITKQEKINTLGYCIGGIILTSAAVLLKQRKLEWINSMAQMTTMLDHSEPGDIKAFLARDLMELREAKKHTGGVMSGRVISQTFSALRANELIWNYWVNNYLLGKTPQKFDILFWNNDTVDLPIPMHSCLMERLYLDNALVRGEFSVDGHIIDLSLIDYPVYLFATQKDHIVPWTSAYKTVNYMPNASIRFVLGASGHTAGVVNPVSSNKRNYWVNGKIANDAELWFKNSTEMPGSWWQDMHQWIAQHSGKLVKFNKLGSSEFPELYSAPGEYVRAKALTILEAETI